uniref:Transmembrane 7 superfamily member 3 n=1 Tax=Phallusia mammillata TaxID=59560 RepID=A0A6F9DVG8_9ASCI|nr:transmembrane 7 superfamily member 3 [Phallusia mammillata]
MAFVYSMVCIFSFILFSTADLRSPYIQDHLKNKVFSIESNHSEVKYIPYNVKSTLNVHMPNSSVGALVHIACEHSSVVLSLVKNFSFGNYVNGSSVGLIVLRSSTLNRHNRVYFCLTSNCSSVFKDKCIITALSFSSKQPVPGGCNLVHNMNIYPMIDIDEKRDGSTRVKFSSANVGSNIGSKPPVCDSDSSMHLRLKYSVYADFTYQANSNLKPTCELCNRSLCKANNDYLNAFSNIFGGKTSFSYKVADLTSSDHAKYHLAAYPCAAMMTYIVVTDPKFGTHSMYIPTTIKMGSYDDSQQAVLALKIITMVLGAVGLLLCLVGHRFFIFELFFMSGMFFVILAICFMEAFGLWLHYNSLNFTILTVIGLLGSISITALWFRFGKAAMFSSVIGIVGGFCFACIIFITPLSNMTVFEYRATFILSLLCGCMVYVLALILVIKMHRMCIVSSALVGSYLVVACIGSVYWYCSLVGQLILIIVRKMTTVDLLDATIVYPLYILDYTLIGAWAGLFVLGVASQHFITKNHPPFPLSPRELVQLQPTMSEEDVHGDNIATDNDSASSADSSSTSVNYDGDISDDPPDYRDIYPEQDTSRLLAN